MIASVQKIDGIFPIEGADKVELCRVLGWNIVVAKGIHKTGDKICLFEIDSLLPYKEYFSFLGDDTNFPYRLKTKKLRGIISQGLVIPYKDVGLDENLDFGTDISETLGILKYSKPIDFQCELNWMHDLQRLYLHPIFHALVHDHMMCGDGLLPMICIESQILIDLECDPLLVYEYSLLLPF